MYVRKKLKFDFKSSLLLTHVAKANYYTVYVVTINKTTYVYTCPIICLANFANLDSFFSLYILFAEVVFGKCHSCLLYIFWKQKIFISYMDLSLSL